MVPLYNLPEECTRQVPDRFQEMVMREDERFRIVRNFVVPHEGRIGSWDLVQRCGATQGFIMPEESLTAYCGWIIVMRQPHHNNHTVENAAYGFVRWAQANQKMVRRVVDKASAKQAQDDSVASAAAADKKARDADTNAIAWEVVDEMKAERKRSGQSFQGTAKKKRRSKRRKLEKSGALEL